ncbi:Acetyl-coenzyme A carboxylase carboxyl transferase subunit alpha, chloroplastic [Apostasia shenzhenica]|uniref:acetyl-CoA carboxytransferase n=1 Tax=Apostasia shenzhenica TaxID=1088818 RepID=A0A2I0ACF5_9ASPA|nr:Acetyl-coenzyme A carboxylase carboxyl transferase subunit alpha, chloroplastic [Apostasia shenzhenica]
MQGEAIAQNLRTMFGLKVPIVSVVIGEGGSGGALAIGCANKLLMLENAIYYVASPEACAAILWKTAQAAPKAAERLKITATELCKLKIADGIIPEPLGGAHTDPTWTSQQIKLALLKAMEELNKMDTDELLGHRHSKYRDIGIFQEGIHVDPERKRNMKKKEVGVSVITANLEEEIEKLKYAVLEVKTNSPAPVLSKEDVDRVKDEADKEMTNAFISMGLQDKLEALKLELSKASPDQNLSPLLKERIEHLAQEFENNLSRSGSFDGLKQRLELLSKINKLEEHKLKGETLKKEVNEKLQNKAKEKMNILRNARHLLAKGEELDDKMLDEIKEAKKDIFEMLKSENLEVVGMRTKISPSVPPALAEKVQKVDQVIFQEIGKVVDKAGLRGKFNELISEIDRGPSKDKEKVVSLIKEIKEGVAS